MENLLPSTQLLRNLLCEPLYSWRNGVRSKPSKKSKLFIKQLLKSNSDSNETPSAGSDTSSVDSDVIKPKSTPKIVELSPAEPKTICHKPPPVTAHPNSSESGVARPKQPKIVELKPDQFGGHESEAERIANTMALVPGLKTKPPLPKKPESGLQNAPRNARRTSPHSLETNFERITLGSLNRDLLAPKFDLPEAIAAEEEAGGSCVHVRPNPGRAPELDASPLDPDNDAIEVKIQNWFREEERASEDIVESELNTDLSFHNLKLQQQKVDNTIGLKACAKEENRAPDGPSSPVAPKKPQSARKSPVTKSVNFSGTLDMDELKADYERHARNRNGSGKNFVKENIKSAATKASKKSNAAEEQKGNRAKFVPSQMKAYADYAAEDAKTHDVESWMSSFQGNRSSKPVAYLDCLSKIDELQESCSKDLHMGDVPERDRDETTTNRSDSSTYDDIISILQVLEEEDKKSQNKIETIKEIVNGLSTPETGASRKKTLQISNGSTETSSCESSNESEDVYERRRKANHHNSYTTDQHRREEHTKRSNGNAECARGNSPRLSYDKNSGCNCTVDRKQNSRQSLDSSTNLTDIFSYLDEVDRSCAKSLVAAKERIYSTTKVLETNIQLDTIPKLEELLGHTNVDLSHYVIDLSLRLKDKSSSIALLQKELSALREQVTKMTKDTSEIVKQKLKTQKEDYENVVKRHQKFIDQLIADKKTLNQQCEGLIHEIKVLEDRYNSNMKAVEHKHKVELQKAKEMQVAGEKIRRERWIDTKTQKIKEMTVRGLEPELEKMSARHQQELTDLRVLHKREIQDLELRAARKTQQQCEMLREQLVAEREKALAHEREVLKQRYEQLVESEEQNYQEQRRRLLAEHAKRVSECEEREMAAMLEKDRAIKQAQAEFEDKLQAAIRRHGNELNVLKETTELEMEAFRTHYKKQMAIQLTEKEVQIRERSRRERDKEIEAVIERLETESSECKKQIEQTTENRLKRLREKYEKEITDLEALEKEASSKCSETKAKLLEAENSVICLRACVKQLETQLHETKELSEKLSNERVQIKDVVREEMKSEIRALEKEVEDLKNDKDKELQQVYARVKLAVARKDETISELNRDHTALQEKCQYLENMLEQQRRDYLIK